MDIPSKNSRLEFWKAAFARSSFVEVLLATRTALELGESASQVIVSCLSTTALVMYARPFKQREAVKLEKHIIPPEYSAFHENLIVYRDKVVAHRDIDGPSTPWGTANDLTVLSDGASIEIHTTSPILEVAALKRLNSLAADLIRLMDERLNPFVQRYIPRPLTAGAYKVSLEDGEAAWLNREVF